MSNLDTYETRYIEYQRSHSTAAYWEAAALISMVVLSILFVLLP